MLGSYRSPIKALSQIATLFAIIWGIGYGISASRWSAQLYRIWRFPNTEAHHLAGKLGQAAFVRTGDYQAEDAQSVYEEVYCSLSSSEPRYWRA